MSLECAIEARAKVRLRSALQGRFRVWVPGLYHNEAMKRAIVNLVSGTLLVHAPRDAGAEALLDELQSILDRFSLQHAVPLQELERRGRLRPIHFARAELLARGPSAGARSSSRVGGAPR
jgi:hypothetical protein